MRNKILYIQEHIDANFKSGRKSFNAGILILDIQKFIKNNYKEILINKTIELADKLSCPDQDVLNIIFENNYKILDYKFNFMIDLYDKFEAMYPQKAKETLRNYSIVHYVSHKPWKNKNSKAQKDFENIANKTNFSEIIKLSLEKNLCNNDLELSFIERLFSIKNHPNKKHKVITIMGIKFKIKRKQK